MVSLRWVIGVVGMLWLAAGAWAEEPAASEELPRIDGAFEDWVDVPVAAELDGAGAGSAARLLRVKMQHSAKTLRFLLELSREEQASRLPEIEILFDTDRDPRTGAAQAGLGADLLWSLGTSDAEAWILDVPVRVPPAALDLRRSPTVSSARFEVSFDRDAQAAGGPAFGAGEMHVVVRDGRTRTSERLTIPAQAALPEEPKPKPAALAREDPRHLRVLTYNVLFDGLFKRVVPHTRILRAIDPDVIFFQELFQHTPEDARDLMREILPGREWHAAGAGRGGAIVSRVPIVATGETGSQRRGFWVQLAPPDSAWKRGPLLLHPRPPCCEDEEGRHRELDATMSWLRKAREKGEVVEGTPIVIAGDMNLVGYSRQLATLVQGQIHDEEVFGASFAPDWDGTALADARPYHTTGLENYTWRGDDSPFPPGRLDFIVYSDSVLRIGNRFVLWTPEMSEEELKAAGLTAEDTRVASDHLPVVADFSWGD